MAKETTYVRMDPADRELAANRAREQGISMAAVLRRAMRRGLHAELESGKPPEWEVDLVTGVRELRKLDPNSAADLVSLAHQCLVSPEARRAVDVIEALARAGFPTRQERAKTAKIRNPRKSGA